MSGAQVTTLGKYAIRGVLGKGAMGTVYDGWDPVIDRRVAIKTVRLPDTQDEDAAEGLARFKREAQAAGRLTHPNIVGVFDYGETDDVAYIVMEFVEGRSLKDVLTANERMTVPNIIALMEDILAGLAFSHGRGVVHRDIKPANIMLTLDDRAKIADFGIARIEASSMTQAGTVLGTPAYMSPEQFMGQVVDRRTDIYSCGVLLYQLLTGDRPFDGSMTAIMHKVLTTVPPRPSELVVTSPASLDGVVAKAMARRPEDRFDTAAAFAAALRDPPADAGAASDETIVAAPRKAPAPVASAPPPTPARRSKLLPVIVGGGVAVAVAAAAALWFMLPVPEAVAPISRQASVAAQSPSVPAASGAMPTPAAPASAIAPAPQPVRPAPVTSPAPASSSPVPPSPVPPAPVPSAPAMLAPTRQASTPPASAPVTAPPSAVQAPSQSYASGSATTPQHPFQAPATLPSSSPFLATVPAPTPPAVPSAPPLPASASGSAPFVTAGSTPPATSNPAPAPTTIPDTQPAPSAAPAGPPPRSVATIEAALASRLPTVKCSLTQAAVSADGVVTLTGVSGDGQPADALRQAVAAADPAGVTANVQSFDGPYCPALDLLRPVADAVGRNRNVMAISQVGGSRSLNDNDVIALQVTMPAFAGFLHVAYLQHDATVAPQVPGPGYPPQTYAARAQIELGTPRQDFEGWHVGPPFGTDMIVAIASTAPLFSRALPDSQPLAAYLASLQAAIDTLRRRGGSVAAAAVVLDTRPQR